MKRAALLATGLAALTSCGLFNRVHGPGVSCQSDSDCNSSEVCFADGCGNPGTDIVVEASSGENAQDFQVKTLRATQDIQLFAPSLLVGSISQPASAGATPTPYQGAVSFLVTGQSVLVPGLQRLFQTTVTPAAGVYSLPIQSGIYAVTALPADVTLPPITQIPIEVAPSVSPEVDWNFPDPSSLVVIQGTVLATVDAGPVPSAMQIRALDPSSLQPVSQTVPVALDGGFALSVLASTALQGSVELLAGPVDPAALVPQKIFVVSTSEGNPTLELGDYGTPVTTTGALVATDGGAIANATVYLQGPVSGGGSFRTADATTGSDGRFTVLTLPSDRSGSFTLWGVPPQSSGSGALNIAVSVNADGGSLGTFTCPDKVVLQSMVLRPDGSALPGVHITATPVAALDSLPFPASGDEADSDQLANFSLHLAAGTYEIDFEPPEQLPRASRYVVVQPTTGEPQTESPFTMSQGRTVTGNVTAADPGSGRQLPAPHIAVKFYRAVSLNGVPASIRLAEGVSDSDGSYSAIFPTR